MNETKQPNEIRKLVDKIVFHLNSKSEEDQLGILRSLKRIEELSDTLYFWIPKKQINIAELTANIIDCIRQENDEMEVSNVSMVNSSCDQIKVEDLVNGYQIRISALLKEIFK